MTDVFYYMNEVISLKYSLFLGENFVKDVDTFLLIKKLNLESFTKNQNLNIFAENTHVIFQLKNKLD